MRYEDMQINRCEDSKTREKIERYKDIRIRR